MGGYTDPHICLCLCLCLSLFLSVSLFNPYTSCGEVEPMLSPMRILPVIRCLQLRTAVVLKSTWRPGMSDFGITV